MNIKTEEKPLVCPECESTNIVKSGVMWSGRVQCQRYLCNKCGRTFLKPLEDIINEQSK